MSNLARRRGVYPGSFNPPTVAHLALSDAAREQHQLDIVVWAISISALGKHSVDADLGAFAQRLHVLELVSQRVEWLEIVTTDLQLLADIAEGYDLLIMGADKWHQIQEAQWYDDIDDRDAALARLPTLAVAPRDGLDVPDEVVLDLDQTMADVSSSAARAGDRSMMLPEAAAHDERTGLWSDDSFR